MIQYVELRRYNSLAANDGYEVLTKSRGLNFDKKRNDIGVINFDYPLAEAQAAGLHEDSLLGVAIGYSSGEVVEVERYLTTTTSDQKVVDDTRFLTLAGESTLSVLKDAVVYPSNWPTTQPSGHEFVDNNIGTIMRTLIQRAKDRGTLTQVVETSFSGTTDSSGAAWNNVFSTNYASGTLYWQVISDRAIIGLADMKMDGWNLRIYNGGTVGSHVDIDTLEVRPAKNVTEMVTNTDRSESYSTVLIEGDEGTALERHSTPAVANIGRRRETYLGQSGITSDGVLSIIGEAFLEQVSTIPTEETVGLTSSTGADPFLDFDISDWVWVRFEGSEAPVERRIYQIAVAVGEGGTISVGLTLNSIIAENLIRLQRKIDAYGSGGALGSIPDPTGGIDQVRPDPPTGILINSSAYSGAGGQTEAAISVSWTTPALNEDGTAFDDLSHFEVQWRYSTDPAFPSDDSGNTYTSYTNLWAYNPLIPGKQVQVRVRAVDNDNNKSLWTVSGLHTVSSDNTAPPQPSQPLAGARLGVMWVTWDGLANGGGAMPPDFKDVQVHGSTTSGFTPIWDNAATLQATFVGPDTAILNGKSYNTTWYFKFLARDRSGNVSVASPQSAGQTVTPLVDTDIIGEIINGANIVDGSMIASEKIVGLSITANELSALSVIAGKLAANSIQATNIQAGALTAFLIAGNKISTSASGTGARVEMTSGGIYGYNSGGTNTFNFLNDGNVNIIGGTIKTTSATGVGARLELNSSGLFAYNGSAQTFALTASGGSGTFNGSIISGTPGAGRAELTGLSVGAYSGTLSFYNSSGAHMGSVYGDNTYGGIGVNAPFSSTYVIHAPSIIADSGGLYGPLVNTGPITCDSVTASNFPNQVLLTTGGHVIASGNLQWGGTLTHDSWGTVSRGAVDSGGNGYRVLRVTN